MSPDKHGFNTFLFLVNSLQKSIIIIERMCFGILSNLSYSVFSFRFFTSLFFLTHWRLFYLSVYLKKDCIWFVYLIN